MKRALYGVHKHLKVLTGTIALLLPLGAALPSATAQTVPPVSITVKDLTPKFLAFYNAAKEPPADEETRWRLWKQLYDFAAVPPTSSGDAIARRLLNTAWPKYPDAMERIRLGPAALQPKPEEMMRTVAALLEATVPIKATVIVFVGGFEGNAFTSPGRNGIPAVAIPVETPGAARLMAHEFTHVVQAGQAGLGLDWQRSIAHTVFAEGLAMRVTQSVLPGLPDRDYVGEFSPGWFQRAANRRADILADVAGHLADTSPEAVFRYTMGTGEVGLEREAYYVGWLVIGDLLHHGWTFPMLARADDAAMTRATAESVARLQQTDSAKIRALR